MVRNHHRPESHTEQKARALGKWDTEREGDAPEQAAGISAFPRAKIRILGETDFDCFIQPNISKNIISTCSQHTAVDRLHMLFWYQVFETLCGVFHPLGPVSGMALPNPEHRHVVTWTTRRVASSNFLKSLLCPGSRTGCPPSRSQSPRSAVSPRAGLRWAEKARVPGRPSSGCDTH